MLRPTTTGHSIENKHVVTDQYMIQHCKQDRPHENKQLKKHWINNINIRERIYVLVQPFKY